jgi:nitroreductase
MIGMMNDFIDIIFSRRSIRKYSDKPVSEEKIRTLLEAAMAAPSASDRKPWHFVVITEREILNQLAKAHSYAKMLYEAPLCISICGDPSISKRFWVQDCSAATENLLLAATALGLGAVWCGVYPRQERVDAIREILDIEEPIIPLNLIAVGHPAEEKGSRTQYDGGRVHREKW